MGFELIRVSSRITASCLFFVSYRRGVWLYLSLESASMHSRLKSSCTIVHTLSPQRAMVVSGARCWYCRSPTGHPIRNEIEWRDASTDDGECQKFMKWC